MPETTIRPDEDAIRQDLEYMTARWGELPERAMFEVRCFKPDCKPVIRRYATDWMDEAVDNIFDMNELGFNVYVTRNPIRDTVTGSATDDDVIASFFLWADCDDPASAGNVYRFDGPKWSAAVTTGRTPAVRVHTYWMLEQPCTDMDAWRDMQKAIAAHFGSDKAVVNPSRIMRVGGTVSYPDAKKQGRGYIDELCEIRTAYDDDRPRVTMDQMRRIFGAVPKHDDGLFKVDTGPQPLDRALAAANIMAGTDWRENVKKLVASYVARGWTDDEIIGRCLAFTLDGWTEEDTRRDVTAFISWTRQQEAQHGGQYAESPQPTFPATIEAESADWPTLFDDFDAAAIEPRQWIYANHYLRSFVSVLASAGGIGKTSLQIVEALSIVTGRPLLGEPVKEPCSVWIINLEDPLDEMKRRILAAMKCYGIKPEDVRGKLFVDAGRDFQMTFAAQTREGVIPNDALVQHLIQKIPERQIGCVFIDPFVGAHQINENDNMAVNAVVSQIRDVADSTRCAIGLVHHIRKGNGEDANIDSVRGAGSLVGAARAARVINRLPEKDALALGIEPLEAAGIFRVDDGKANLAPPAQKAVYRQMQGVQIANGEWIGVAVPFELPDEWSGMSEAVVNEILGLIDKGMSPDTEEYYSARPQDKKRWVGQVIMDYPFSRAEDFKNQAQAKAIVKKWVDTGLLEEVEFYSASQRKDRKGVISTGRVGESK